MNNRGFVRAFVMEGLIGIAILGIIAAIAVPQYINYRNRDLNKEAKTHVHKAYEASQAFFRINPKAQPTVEDISRYGYQSSPDITLFISGNKENLFITARHLRSNKTYQVDAKGELSTD
jgi:Tfp pilus assembly protein PilE